MIVSHSAIFFFIWQKKKSVLGKFRRVDISTCTRCCTVSSFPDFIQRRLILNLFRGFAKLTILRCILCSALINKCQHAGTLNPHGKHQRYHCEHVRVQHKYSLTELLAWFQTLVMLLTVSTFMLIINVSCAFGYYDHNWFCMTAARLAKNSFQQLSLKTGSRKKTTPVWACKLHDPADTVAILDKQ